ncbi:MAG: hypothetical protein GW878_04110, partial [Acidobacteria bacterium]|nr:hypothetical protein [Acidobacteriota bacterium]
MICHEEFCVYARDYGVKLQQRAVVPTVLAGAPHLDPDRIFDIAKAAEVCPFEVSLELLRHVTAVVCDYNYVFDPAIALGGLADEASLEDTYLVIDEAHNLLDRAREYHSPRLGLRGIEAARALIDGRRAKVCCDLVDVLGEVAELIRTTVSVAVANRTACAEQALPLASLTALRLAFDALIPDYFTYKRNAQLWLAEDPVIRVLLDLARLVDVLEDGGREFVTLAERTGGATADEVIRVFCLDASRFTGQVLDRCTGAIAMSATMEPFEFHRDLLGFDPDRTDTLALPSPFPPENRLIIAVDEVDTSFRERDRHWGRIAELIAELAPVGRNALALFPSYAFLRQVSDRLVAPGHVIEVQRGDFSDAARADLFRRLAGRREPMLLLAVLGGA